jgi:hypothetical protein
MFCGGCQHLNTRTGTPDIATAVPASCEEIGVTVTLAPMARGADAFGYIFEAIGALDAANDTIVAQRNCAANVRTNLAGPAH